MLLLQGKDIKILDQLLSSESYIRKRIEHTNRNDNTILLIDFDIDKIVLSSLDKSFTKNYYYDYHYFKNKYYILHNSDDNYFDIYYKLLNKKENSDVANYNLNRNNTVLVCYDKNYNILFLVEEKEYFNKKSDRLLSVNKSMFEPFSIPAYRKYKISDLLNE